MTREEYDGVVGIMIDALGADSRTQVDLGVADYSDSGQREDITEIAFRAHGENFIAIIRRNAPCLGR